VEELREVHLGDWEVDHEFARRVARRDPLIRELLERERWDTVPGAEGPEAFASRERAGVERVLARLPPGDRVAVFTHAGVIAEACRQATGSRPFAFLRAENASITRIVVDRRGRLSLQTFNDVSHLHA
jgi:2,3-bisphosphoglycerate-dependent phosphoglycerate mutase